MISIGAQNVLSFFLFADDTKILYSNSNIHTLTKTVNEELNNVPDWLKANKLSLHIKKTQLLIFKTRNKKTNHQVNITLNNANIKQVESARFWESISTQISIGNST